ncbi:MAG: extracellular solute-binding protein [Clostridia bacterium]|nr:extracellular solute-binding protein [Clostridia bacterium]
MKKFAVRLISFILVLCTMTSFVGCSKKEDNIVNDGKTLNVRLNLAGYGTDWLYEMKDKFETAYAADGYKVNILNPSNSVQGQVVVNELYNGGNGVDLYFAGNVTIDMVTEQNDYGKTLVEDITDTVYKQKPIKFDGTEEDITIEEKLKKGYEGMTYNDRYYGFPVLDGMQGLVVNEEKLSLYGYELPRTTDEMMSIFDSVMLGKDADGADVGKPDSTLIYPHTFFSGNTMYPVVMFSTWYAQYLGFDEYRGLNSFEMEGKTTEWYLSEGYKVYEGAQAGVESIMTLAYQMFDLNYCTQGSNSQLADAANLKITDPDEGAIFFSAGNWTINEVKGQFPEEAKALRFINYPVLSVIGKEAFGDVVTDSKKCDEVLSEVVKLVDEQKSTADIITAIKDKFDVTVSEDGVERVREARLIYYCRGNGFSTYVTKDSPVKDIAAKFLRMLTSDDAAELMFNTIGVPTAYDKANEKTSTYKFSQDSAKFANAPGSMPIGSVTSGAAKKMAGGGAVVAYNESYLHLRIIKDGASSPISKWVKGQYAIANPADGNKVYIDAAKSLYAENLNYAKSQWAAWAAKV